MEHVRTVGCSACKACSAFAPNDFRKRIESGDFHVFEGTHRTTMLLSIARNYLFPKLYKILWGLCPPVPDNKLCFTKVTHNTKLYEDGAKCLSVIPPE